MSSNISFGAKDGLKINLTNVITGKKSSKIYSSRKNKPQLSKSKFRKGSQTSRITRSRKPAHQRNKSLEQDIEPQEHDSPDIAFDNFSVISAIHKKDFSYITNQSGKSLWFSN